MRHIGPITKKVLLSLLLFFGVAAAAYVYSVWQLVKLNDDPQFQHVDGNLICRFHAGATAFVSPVSGRTVNFDLGSRHSFINRSSAENLAAMGFRTRFLPTLIFTVDPDGRYRMYTEKVIIDVTLPNPELPDSLFVIRNVELLLVDNGHPNVIGMDMLRGLVVERLWPEGVVSLYKEVPGGYHSVCDITVHDSPFGYYAGSTGRASINLAVNDEAPREYFLDTGGNMRGIEVVQPYGNIRLATTRVEVDSLTGYWTQRRCRVSFGNRMRFSSVVYCDTIHTDEYSVNPLMLFDQDFIIDMKGRRLMVHKTREP